MPHESLALANSHRSRPTNRLFLHVLAMAAFVGTSVSAQDLPSPAATANPAAKTADLAKPRPFKLERVPKFILEKDGPYLAMIGYARNGRNGRTGIFTHPGCNPLRFKMRTDENKVEKMTVDLDGDGKFDGEPEFNAPKNAEGITQAVVKKGKTLQIRVAKAGMDGYALRNAQWYRGQIELNGKLREVAVIDLDFNGLKFDGTDAYVLDANGDGKLVPWIADPEAPLKETLLLGGTVCAASFDAKAGTLVMGEMTELASITVKAPVDWKNVVLKADTVVARRSVQVKVDGATLKLPPGKHDRVAVHVSALTAKKETISVTYNLEKVDAKLKDDATITLPKPISVKPVIRQTNGGISVKAELVFEKGVKNLTMGSRFYASGSAAPGPKVTLYKGQKSLANGAMTYG